jgi:hypothetical protein
MVLASFVAPCAKLGALRTTPAVALRIADRVWWTIATCWTPLTVAPHDDAPGSGGMS